MNFQEIKDKYATEQGFTGWLDLLWSFPYDGDAKEIEKHIDAVSRIRSEESLKNAANRHEGKGSTIELHHCGMLYVQTLDILNKNNIPK